MFARLARARTIATFASWRVGDYAELLKLEVAQYRKALVLSMVGLVALALCGVATGAFVSVAVLVTYWDTPIRVPVAWAIAAVWAVLAIVAAWLASRVTREDQPFATLADQIRLDIEAVKGRDADVDTSR